MSAEPALAAVPRPRGPFTAPPFTQNPFGETRRCGVEIEYTGPSLETSASIIKNLFGGTIAQESSFVFKVKGTKWGEFTVEIDSSVLTEKKYEHALRFLGIERIGGETLENSLAGLFSWVVPFEISTPPVPLNELHLLDDLRERLQEANALGTTASLFYAFGMHLNVELPVYTLGAVQEYLRAFLVLAPWVHKRVGVDISRKVSAFSAPFPEEFATEILKHRLPDEEFVNFYMKHNPSRNRALDLLPTLRFLAPSLVNPLLKEPSLVTARPALHYRLPNSLVDDPEWTLRHEWETWVEVEFLASNPDRLNRLAAQQLESLKAPEPGIFGEATK